MRAEQEIKVMMKCARAVCIECKNNVPKKDKDKSMHIRIGQHEDLPESVKGTYCTAFPIYTLIEEIRNVKTGSKTNHRHSD